MRSKEESHDYRYFPEPDLPPLVLSATWLDEVKQELPELPAARRARFIRAYELPENDAGVLTGSRTLAEYYEAVVAGGVPPKDAANWVMNDVLALSPDGETLTVSAAATVAAIQLVKAGKVSRQNGRKVLARITGSGTLTLSPPQMAGAAERVAEELGVLQVSDTGHIEAWVSETLAAQSAEVERYRKGETKLLGFLVGQVMKRSKGKADPKAVGAALEAALKG